jgi:hypothetical protein
MLVLIGLSATIAESALARPADRPWSIRSHHRRNEPARRLPVTPVLIGLSAAVAGSAAGAALVSRGRFAHITAGTNR